MCLVCKPPVRSWRITNPCVIGLSYVDKSEGRWVKYPTQGCENLTGAQGGDRVSAQALLEVHRPSDAGAARWAGPQRALSLGPSRR